MLNDDAAALAYACEIVRELMQGLTYADRSSLVKVRDETRPMVFSIPFLRRVPEIFKLLTPRIKFRACPPAWSLAFAGKPFDFGLDHLLDHAGQVFVQP